MKTLHSYKAVIFDFDGTLVDSLDMWQEIDQQYLSEKGLTVPEDLHEAIAGMSFEETAVYFKKRFFLDDPLPVIMQTWLDMSNHSYETSIPPIPGAQTFLSYLKNAGMKIGLATSNTVKPTTACLKRLGLYDYFDCFCFTGGDVQGKPDPAVFLNAAKALGVRPEECLAVEDSLEGILSAKNAGMTAISVEGNWSAERSEKIVEASDLQVEDLNELFVRFVGEE